MLLQEFTYKDYGEVRYDEGREEGVISVARELLSTNLTVEEIARVTGLTREEVDHMRMMN